MAAPVVVDDNRTRILRAAEELFAQHGIDGVSLREINRVAGQRNASALQYHFGDRAGLVHAVLARHQYETEPRRHALLDEYEASAVGDVRALAAALVLPLVDKLSDRNGGRAYLQVACEFYTRARSIDDVVFDRDRNASMVRWHRLLDGVLPLEERTVLPARFSAVRLALAELARRASEPSRRDHRLFASHLTDLVAAVLGAPVSAETARRLRDREPRRRKRSSAART